MKQISNWFIPRFLQRLDAYLLRNYPVVWRTKTVFVLFYGSVAAVLLFAAGFCYPVDAQHLTVEPYNEIRMGYDNYYLLSVVFVSFGVLYWAYLQYQLGFPFTKVKDTLLTLFLYALCFYVLFAFTTPAFRLGTIYKTAYHWIDDKDMQELAASHIYPYGFIFLKEDSIYKGTLPDTFFQSRERIFESIWRIEDTLLTHFYSNDTLFWKNWFIGHDLDRANYLLDNYQLYKSYLSGLSYGSYESYLSGLSYSSYLLYRSDVSDVSHLPYLSYQSYLSSYETYKQQHAPSAVVYKKYNFKHSTDSVKVKVYDLSNSVAIYRATLPYSVEHAMYSVKNARLYLAEKVYTRHWALVLKYAFLLAVLFYCIPFLSIRHLFILLIACLIGSIVLAFKLPEEINEDIGRIISNGAYLLLPMVSFLLLAVSAFQKKQLKGLVFAEQGLFLGLLCVLIGALFIIYRTNMERGIDNQSFKTFQPPYDLAFYGVQFLGVLGALLTTYVRSLPKA